MPSRKPNYLHTERAATAHDLPFRDIQIKCTGNCKWIDSRMIKESLYITRERKKYWNRVEFLTYATLGTSDFDSRYRWNPELGVTGRYIDRDGRIVKQGVVTDQLEKVITGVQSDMIGLALDLQDGKINVQQWYDTFKSQIKIGKNLSRTTP